MFKRKKHISPRFSLTQRFKNKMAAILFISEFQRNLWPMTPGCKFISLFVKLITKYNTNDDILRFISLFFIKIILKNNIVGFNNILQLFSLVYFLAPATILPTKFPDLKIINYKTLESQLIF